MTNISDSAEICSDRFFLIIGLQRSGTTALMHLLCRHPQVCGCECEISLPWFFGSGTEGPIRSVENGHVRRRIQTAAFFSATQFSVGDGTAHRRLAGAKSAVGSAHDFCSIEHELCERYPLMKIVFLWRADTVALAASLARARTTNQWQSWEKKELQDVKVDVSLPHIAWLWQQNELLKNAIERMENPTLAVKAEDLFDEFVSVAQNIFRFLEISTSVEVDNPGKLSPPLEDYVRNLDVARDFEAKLRSGSQPSKLLAQMNSGFSKRLAKRVRRVAEGVFLPSEKWQA